MYIRKGGSGFSGTPRQAFNYYKGQLLNRLVEEQAFKEARGVGTIEARIRTLFENTDYDKVYNEGITRKINNQTVRLKGMDAIYTQIESFRARASKTYQNEMFIRNYLKPLRELGFEAKNIELVDKLLHKASIDKIRYLLQTGRLPEIAILYNEKISEEEFMEDFQNALKFGVTNEQLKDLRKKKRELIVPLKKVLKIIGW